MSKGVDGVQGVRPGGGTPTVRPVGPPGGPVTHPVGRVRGADFQHVLAQRLATRDVRFSAHALERLRTAGVQLGSEQHAKLRDAVDRAAAKGARESLVLLENLALVVSVKNRTVITAVDGARMKDNVFTNIDSAVIT